MKRPPEVCVSRAEGAVTRPCIVGKRPPGSKYRSTSGLSPRELRLPLEMSPGREAACRAVFGTWGFFPNDARKNCPFVLTSFIGGKVAFTDDLSILLDMSHLANQIENRRYPFKPPAGHFMSVNHQLIKRQRRLEADRRAREQSGEVYGDRAVGRQAQRVIAIAPIFDEGDIGMALGGGRCHGPSLSPCVLRTTLATAGR